MPFDGISSVGIKYTVINTVDFVGMWRYLMGRLGTKGKSLTPKYQGLWDVMVLGEI